MMTRKMTMSLMAGVTAAMIGSAALTAPAVAGGSISFDIKPKNDKQAKGMQAGLAIYGIVNAVQGGASIKQLGQNNMAGIGQNGGGNFGVVHQEGNGHAGTLQQNGNNNAYGIFQFGKNTNSNVVQNGNGDVGATFQFGW